jgi:hypothetical protein
MSHGDSNPGDGNLKWNIQGDSGGVTGISAAEGDGGASSLARKRVRRSAKRTHKKLVSL